MTDEVLSRAMWAAFCQEVEKVGGFSLLGRAATAAGKGVGSFAMKNPKAALGTAAAGLGTLYVGNKVLKGAKEGYKQHSYGALPGTHNTTSYI